MKDDAGAMSKYEVQEALKKELGRDYYKIKPEGILEVLGAASMKTVVLVELVDGRKVVAMVQDPYIYDQVMTNLKLSDSFITALEEQGVSPDSDLFKLLIKGMREQIVIEMQMKIEAEMFQKMNELTNEINIKYGASLLDGWKVSAPRLIGDFEPSDSVLFVELASGVNIDDLVDDHPDEAKSAGEAIVLANLIMLFEYGYFDGDRHKGNHLIDIIDKVINFIDPGQLWKLNKGNYFQWDDRLTIARFMQAIVEKNSLEIISMSENMMDEKNPSVDKNKLKTEIDDLFVEIDFTTNSDEFFTELVKKLNSGGIEFNTKYLFGVLKGLLILAGENYVSIERFSELLNGFISDLYKKKPVIYPKLFVEEVLGRKNKTVSEGTKKPNSCDNIYK